MEPLKSRAIVAWAFTFTKQPGEYNADDCIEKMWADSSSLIRMDVDDLFNHMTEYQRFAFSFNFLRMMSGQPPVTYGSTSNEKPTSFFGEKKRLTLVEFRILMKALARNTNLLHLILNDRILHNRLKYLARALMPSNNNTLRILNLSNSRIGLDDAYHIANILKHNSSLLHLGLIYTVLELEGVSVIVDALVENKSLASLHLDDKKIKASDLGDIMQVLARNENLIDVSISGCEDDREDVEDDREDVEDDTVIWEIYLPNLRGEDDTVLAIADALKHNKSLLSLHLSKRIDFDDKIELENHYYVSNRNVVKSFINDTLLKLNMKFYEDEDDCEIESVNDALERNRENIYIGLYKIIKAYQLLKMDNSREIRYIIDTLVKGKIESILGLQIDCEKILYLVDKIKENGIIFEHAMQNRKDSLAIAALNTYIKNILENSS